MIKSITITNPRDESLVLSLFKPGNEGLVVMEMDGIGPVKADIAMTNVATMDGGLYNSARLPTRNITMKLGFLPSPTIEDARQKTYRYFPVKKQIKIEIESDNRTCYTYGFVESNTPSIWSDLETCQISIICPNPYFFESGYERKVVFSMLENHFEFEFSNESINEKLINFADIERNFTRTIDYDGDSPTGMVMTIHCTGVVTGLVITKEDTLEFMRFDDSRIRAMTGAALGSGDELIISTVSGDKHVYLLRSGSYINLINALSRDSDWPGLDVGSNTFTYTATQGANDMYVVLTYRHAYQGV